MNDSLTKQQRGAAKRLTDKVWQLHDAGRPREAVNHCRALNRDYPSYGPGWYTASQLAARMGNAAAALEAIRRALQLDPESDVWRLQEASCLMRLGHFALAKPIVRELYATAFSTAYHHATLALLLSRLNLQQQALTHYAHAVEIEPREAQHHYNLATIHRFLGDVDAADEALERALSLDPDDADAHKLRSELRRQTVTDNHLRALDSALARTGENNRSSVSLHYALAKELEDLGRYRESFAHLATGAKLRRRHMRYSVDGDLDTMAEIARVFSADQFRQPAQLSPASGPIFVLGMPRTGTTLVERMLGSHSAVTSAGELNEFAHCLSRATQGGPGRKLDKQARVQRSRDIDFAELGRQYLLEARIAVDGAARFIDKMPLNFLYAGIIHKALPGSRIIHLRRDPMDTCYAVLKTLFTDAYPFSYNQVELGRYFSAYQQLMAHWDEVMPGVVLHVDYESLVNEPQAQLRRILAYCDLPWESACLQFHQSREASTTASASQIRQPVYTSSIGNWRHYQEELAPLLDTLEGQGITTERAAIGAKD